jgi:S-adenosylmethionine decarboxylase
MGANLNLHKKSLQISADFLECKNKKFLSDLNYFKKIIEKVLKISKINKIKSISYVFNGRGFTYLAILKESHLAFHTWPEKNLVNIDIFLCNFSQNNEKKIKSFLEEIEKILNPVSKIYKRIKRIT